MNTIAFQLISFDKDIDQDYLVVQTRVDDKPLVDFEAFATDLRAVEQSITDTGPMFILTCWCGVPDCVGLRHGINVFHEGATIRWRIPAPLPAQTLIFGRAQYEAAHQACLFQGKRRIASRRYTTTKPFTITPEFNRSYFGLDKGL